MSGISRAAAKRLGVEPGISGKELQFQQNQKFGPGAMKPFPFSKPPTPRSNRGDGVFYGKIGAGRGRYGTPKTGLLNRGEQRA